MNELTNKIAFKPGFVLFIGRKKSIVRSPARLEMKRVYEDVYFRTEDTTPSRNILVSETVTLFIANKLFATMRATDRGRGSVRISKPLKGRKPTEIRLLRKYTTLEAKER